MKIGRFPKWYDSKYSGPHFEFVPELPAAHALDAHSNSRYVVTTHDEGPAVCSVGTSETLSGALEHTPAGERTLHKTEEGALSEATVRTVHRKVNTVAESVILQQIHKNDTYETHSVVLSDSSLEQMTDSLPQETASYCKSDFLRFFFSSCF